MGLQVNGHVQEWPARRQELVRNSQGAAEGLMQEWLCPEVKGRGRGWGGPGWGAGLEMLGFNDRRGVQGIG